MKSVVSIALLVAVAGCPKSSDKKPVEPAAKRDAAVVSLTLDDAAPALPPAPPLPVPPIGLPAVPAHERVTPDTVALGELLFHDARLSTTGTHACASCHVPAQGFAGAVRQATAAGKQNLRRAPTLVNLAWIRQLGWDGAYDSVDTMLAAHVRGQLGRELGDALPALVALPLYRAHFQRVGGEPADAARAALAAYTLTRYSGAAPWDRLERDPSVPAILKTGYQVFTGKAQCATCHAPPLYVDHAFHRLGLIKVADEGRGRVDKAQAGAFRTPTLRGAARRAGFFHDASATTLDQAIDWHLAGGTGQGADPSIIDPALRKVTLTADERAALKAFLEALSDGAPAPKPPALP